MRRRIRSAAFPLHRHSLPQLAVDGALVALAYYLAFQLRFNNGPPRHYEELRSATIWWVFGLSLPVLVLARVYQRRWRYAGQRDYEAVVRAVVLIVLLTVVGIEIFRPTHAYPELAGGRHAKATVAVVLPNGVIVLYALLALAFLVGVRALARMIYERRPLAAFRSSRKGDRTVLIAGAGEGGRMVLREILRNRELGLVPVGFLDDDPAKRRPAHRRRPRARRHRSRPAADPRRRRARRSDHRDPLGAGLDTRADRPRVPPAGHPGADAADRVRAAADPRRARPAGARGARRGRARARARAHGARARRRLPRGPGRARDGRRRLDRL